MLWNIRGINYFNLNKPFLKGKHGYLQECNFTIGELDKSIIENVLTGNKTNRIAIIVKTQSDHYNLISWDIIKNFENEAFTVNPPFKIVWDQQGELYIVNDETVVFSSMRSSF